MKIIDSNIMEINDDKYDNYTVDLDIVSDINKVDE